jgi:hypothetical protein
MINKERFEVYQKNYRIKNKDLIKEKYKAFMLRMKMEVFSHYSNGTIECSCCGENTLEFLTIDHINGCNKEQRKKEGKPIYRYLKKHNYPEGYRILCCNCNLSLGFYGYCPHKK